MTILFEGTLEELAYELDLNPSIFEGLRELGGHEGIKVRED
ncbi:hypothetical protein [Kocuria rhizophila]|nr:hypothetical protein [Kocuria rhizophila]